MIKLMINYVVDIWNDRILGMLKNRVPKQLATKYYKRSWCTIITHLSLTTLWCNCLKVEPIFIIILFSWVAWPTRVYIFRHLISHWYVILIFLLKYLHFFHLTIISCTDWNSKNELPTLTVDDTFLCLLITFYYLMKTFLTYKHLEKLYRYIDPQIHIYVFYVHLKRPVRRSKCLFFTLTTQLDHISSEIKWK